MTMLRVMVWQLMIVDSDLLQRRIGGSLFPAQHKLMKRAHLISTTLPGAVLLHHTARSNGGTRSVIATFWTAQHSPALLVLF